MIDKVIEEYLQDIKIRCAYGTYKFYREKLTHFSLFCKNNNIKNLEAFKRQVTNYLSVLGNVKNSTKNKYITSINQLYKYTGSVFYIKRLKTDTVRYEALTLEEVKQIVEYSKSLSLDNQLIISLLVDTGMRLNELLNIEVVNIDLERSRILLTTTKTGKPRYVFYSKLTRFNLELKVKNLRFKRLFLFTGSKVNHLMQKIKKELKIKVSAHMFRHFFATNLLKNGVDIYAVKELLGHSHISSTVVYLHYNTNELQARFNEYVNKVRM